MGTGDNGAMDTTTTAPDGPLGTMRGDIEELITSLDRVDPAEAPEIAAEIARRLTDGLDAVPGAAAAEQLRAFDRAAEGED